MAVSCSYPQILAQGGSIRKSINKVSMFHESQLPTSKKPTTLQIKSPINNKVFEDKSRGIVCYKDENGEIICEGIDEGPRFHQRKAFHQKELGIVEILERSLLQTAEVDEVSYTEKGIASMENFDWNGFRRYC